MPQSTFYLGEISGLLGRLWLREVDTATMQALSSPSFWDLYESLGGFVPEDLGAESIEKLAVEYCELLIGPKGHISPVQSVWAANQLQSGTSAAMNRFFELVLGYQAQSNLSDHLGVQLDFAGVLLQSDEEAAQGVLNLFAQQHLNWAYNFLDKVETQTDSDFYLGLARVTRSMIDSIGD